MDTRELEEIRKRELRAILDTIRFECQDLIDDYFIAFCASGRSVEEWNLVSQYEHLLFKALNDEQMTFEERRGALKLVRAYFRSVIETLQIEALYRSEGKREKLRQS